MTVSHGLLSSTLLAGIVFAATTLPLTALGSQPITLKVEEKTVFSGRLEDLATPYLTLTTALSLGVGVAAFGLLGWQSASRKLNHVEEKNSILQQQLQEKEALLEHFKFSEKKLQAMGLNFFLESDVNQPTPHTLQSQAALQQDWQSLNYAVAGLSQQASHATTNSNGVEMPSSSLSHNSYNLKDAAQVEALLANLKQVMNQIEKLQAS